MNNNDDVPPCFGYYPKPIAPNNCQSCGWGEVCRKIVAKERLQPLIAKVLEVKQILRS